MVEAGSLEEVEAALAASPETDLVLLDLNMPGMQGFSGLVLLRAQFPSTPVAVISANEEAAVVRRALEFGAAGYITKSASPDEIRAALRAMLAGEMWLPPGHRARAARRPTPTRRSRPSWRSSRRSRSGS